MLFWVIIVVVYFWDEYPLYFSSLNGSSINYISFIFFFYIYYFVIQNKEQSN